MRICVLGWYGTETVGDRAILDGIFNIFNSIEKGNNFSIGSLFPVLTERTLFEDFSLYRSNIENIVVNYFDVKEKSILNKEIKNSDLVIMGGGPIMELDELGIVSYSFKYAKKNKKKTILFGCGYNELRTSIHKKLFSTICFYSDLILLRDKASLNALFFQYRKLTEKTFYLPDPAVVSILKYSKENKTRKGGNYWTLNIRDLKYVYGKEDFETRTINVLRKIEEQLFDEDLVIFPMHTFCVGGDDRYAYVNYQMIIDSVFFGARKNLELITRPLSLENVYELNENALGTIGMRYHSVVIQTLLNGNNYILNYTGADKGKIHNFISDIDGIEFYRKRTVDLINDDLEKNLSLDKERMERFVNKKYIADNLIDDYKNIICGFLIEE